MDNQDRPGFVEVLTGLAEIYGKDLTKEQIEIYWRSMNDWSIDEVKDAAGYLLKICQYMPKPYDFEQLRKKGETSAHDAWSLALDHATSGHWRHGELGDALIDKVVRMLGGYRDIALSKTDQLRFLQRRFIDAYDDLSSAAAVRESLPDMSKVKALIE